MGFRSKVRRLLANLAIAACVLTGNAFAGDDLEPGEVSPPESPESGGPAPRHRVRQALIDRPTQCDACTLNEMFRHLGWDQDACPLCGRACGSDDSAAAHDTCDSLLTKAPFFRRLFTPDGDDRHAPEAAAQRKAPALRPGEPAQLILDLKRRLGSDVFAGTEFGGSPEVLIEWIRALDNESRRQSPNRDADDSPGNVAAIASPPASQDSASEIDALRKAARKLGEAADLLEEQNLFYAADQVRAEADALRRQARERFEAAALTTAP